MPTESSHSSAPPHGSEPHGGGAGLFQMLGLGLFVVFLLIVVLRSLFASA